MPTVQAELQLSMDPDKRYIIILCPLDDGIMQSVEAQSTMK